MKTLIIEVLKLELLHILLGGVSRESWLSIVEFCGS